MCVWRTMASSPRGFIVGTVSADPASASGPGDSEHSEDPSASFVDSVDIYATRAENLAPNPPIGPRLPRGAGLATRWPQRLGWGSSPKRSEVLHGSGAEAQICGRNPAAVRGLARAHEYRRRATRRAYLPLRGSHRRGLAVIDFW